MDPALQFLQTWYQRQCNGLWEHSRGLTIETLLHPGWLVTIDLAETALESKTMVTLSRERSEKDWIHCEVAHGQFRGQGDVLKLAEILHVFQAWATSYGEVQPTPITQRPR